MNSDNDKPKTNEPEGVNEHDGEQNELPYKDVHNLSLSDTHFALLVSFCIGAD